MGLIDSLLGHAGETDTDKVTQNLAPMLAQGERVERAFAYVRDLVVFTDRRLIFVNKQGITASKVEYRSIPYRSIVMYSVETAGHFDLDSDLKVWISGQTNPLQTSLGRGKGAQALVALLAEHTPR